MTEINGPDGLYDKEGYYKMTTEDAVQINPESASITGLTFRKSNQMDADWLSFSKTMESHIAEMRKKYQISDNVEIAQLLPMGWSLGDALKYAYEVVRWIDDPLIMQRANIKEQMKENLLKAAHCIQITYSKLNKS